MTPRAATPPHRQSARPSGVLSEILFGVVMGALLLVVLAAAVLGLYLLKNALGIDLFPDHHLSDFIPLLTILDAG